MLSRVGFSAFSDRLFETFSIDFGLLELAWEPFEQKDVNMCEKVDKMTSILRL